MQPTTTSVLDRYLEKVIQDNKTIDARGVMQVNRMIELSMEDVFIHLTARMNRSDKQPFVGDDLKWVDSFFELEPKPGHLSTFRRIPRVPEILRPSYFDSVEIEKAVSTDELWQRHVAWVLLGDPGAGKTTLLKYLALHEATTYKTGEGYLPIFLPLRLFGKKFDSHALWLLEEAILNYLADFGLKEMGFEAEQDRQMLRKHFQSALSTGHALLLLDGLDEQRDSHIQNRTVEAIESLYTSIIQAIGLTSLHASWAMMPPVWARHLTLPH